MKPFTLLAASALLLPASLSADWQPVSPQMRPAPVMRSPQAPRGNIFGIVNRFQGMQTTSQAYAAHIDLSSGTVIPLHHNTLFSPYVGEDYLLQTNTLRKGEIICPSLMDGFEGYAVTWDFIDLESGRYLRSLDFGADLFANAYSMTYNPVDDLIYVVALDGDTDGQFSVVDPADGFEVTYVGNLRTKAGFIAAIAYNVADGLLYAFNDNNNVYTLDPASGNLVEAGYLELPTGELLFTEGVSGQVVYSPADQMFICIFRDDSLQASRILYIHPETFEVFEGAVLTADPVPYVTSIFCADEFALPEAPEQPALPVSSFEGASLSGFLKVTAPAYSYAGESLGSLPLRMILTIDGDTFLDDEMLPGAVRDIPMSLPEGLHSLVLTSALGDAVSPERRFSLYVGHDAPRAPEGLSLSGNMLSWESVGGSGEHNGFVDTDAVTYLVYCDGTLLTPAPVTATSLLIEVPSDFKRREFTVTASANGHTSAPGTLSALFGTAFDLPFHQAPSQEETAMYEVFNLNNDERAWFFTDRSADPDSPIDPTLYGWCFATGYMATADDWLMLPPVKITDPGMLHTLSYNLRGIFTLPTIESYEVWVGRTPTPEGMLAEGTCILSNPRYHATDSPETISLNFGVPEAGEWYLAFHATGSPATESQGILIGDLDIRSAGIDAIVPADPTDVSITAAPLGAKSLLLSAVMPTLDLAGRPLPDSLPITLRLAEDESEVVVKGLPGESVSAELPVSTSGFHYPVLTPSSSNGDGYSRHYSLYAGLDRPTAPRDIRLEPTADNLSIRISWDAPETIGENGGYVDPAQLTYRIYARTDSNSAMLMGETSECEYTLAPFSESQPPLTAYTFGVAAANEGGESRNTIYEMEQLGSPYELPMMEEWGGSFSYSPYKVETSGEYAGSSWEVVADMDGMGIGDPDMIQGGLIAFATDGTTPEAMLSLPKANTKGIARANFILRYWDYSAAPASIYVYGRRFGEPELKLLSTFRTDRPATGKWVDGIVALPEGFTDSPWIEIRVGCRLTGGADEYLVLDSFQFISDAERDLKLTALTAPDMTVIGETITCRAGVANSGKVQLGGALTIEISGPDGTVYTSDRTEFQPLASNRSFDFETEFAIDGSLRGVEGLSVVARIECDDEDAANNTRSIPLSVAVGTLPVVNDLSAVIDDSDVKLDWSVPPTEYGDFETFEEFDPFWIGESFGQWLNYDLDGMRPALLGNSNTGQVLQWPGSNEPQGWTVVDIEAIGFMQEPRLAPHSGKKVLMARSGDYPDEDNPLQSSKWLISPEVKGGTDLSFWMSTLAPDLKEYIEVWYSTTDTALDPENATSTRNGSFRRLRTFSKEGAETWEYIKCSLPAGTKYFAIRYCSYDSAAVVIDDISFTPAQLLTREIKWYALYRSDDGGLFRRVGGDLMTPGFTDNSWPDSKAWYYLTVVGATEAGPLEGAPSNHVFVNGSGAGVDGVEADGVILAQPGRVILKGLEGKPYGIFTSDGRTVASGTVNVSSLAISLAPGIYIVKAGDLVRTLIL